MASSDRIDELKRKFDENPRRYFAPLANEFRKSGDVEQAILICQEFLPQQPGHMSGHIVYGQALYESGRLDEARGVFETALSLDPENLIALRHLGDIAGGQGDAPTARRWYERVLEADPRNDEIHSLIAALGDGRGESARPADARPAMPPTDAPSIIGAEPFAQERESAEQTAEHRHQPEPVPAPDLLDLDLALPGSQAASPAAAEPAPRDEHLALPDFGGGTTPSGIVPTPETSELMPTMEDRANGFEAGEFTAPETPVEQTPGLQTSYEVETGVHAVFFAPLPGLDRPESTSEEAPPLATTSAFPELDEPLPVDQGDVVPPHGDPMGESAPAPSPALVGRDETLLDFDMPIVDEPSRETHAAVGEGGDQLEPETAGAVADSPLETIPTELPPEVIAAEAELIDAGASIDAPQPPADVIEENGESIGGALSFLDVDTPANQVGADAVAESSSEPASELAGDGADDRAPEPLGVEQRPFVTETMAELYLKQGFRQEALSVYQQLVTMHPGDQRLAAKVASLHAELTAPAKRSGPPVREFFARFAARRPGEKAAASALPAFDDFGPSDDDATPARSTTPVASPVVDAERATTAEDAASQARVGGSIDALFGNQAVGAPEDSAASALAQAFGAGGTSAPIAGNPTRPATGELTLDSVFRDGGSRGPRTSQGFSFEQFFSQNVDGERTSGGEQGTGDAPAPGEPAERGEDDIEQFNSWLQGLKQR